MSLIDFVGFEDALGPETDTTGKWSLTGTGITLNNSALTGRTGNYAARYVKNDTLRGGLTRSLDATEEHQTVIFGRGIFKAQAADEVYEFASDANATPHITVILDATGAVVVRRGDYASGTILATSAVVAPNLSTWYYLEAKVTLSDTVGEATVRVNGVNAVNLTGIDTKNGGTKTVIDSVTVARSKATNGTLAASTDDIYIVNGAGSSPLNDFLGSVAIYPVRPNATGSANQWTNSTATAASTNWSFTDDQSMTDYVQSSTSAQRDLYATTDLPVSVGTVPGVKMRSLVQNTDATLRQVKLGIKSGATVDMDAGQAIGAGTAQTNVRLMKANPVTSLAWTVADVNAMEMGVEVA
jgi:hypothetical protein